MTTTPATRRAAYGLRQEGMSYADIATALGFSSANVAFSAVKRHCNDHGIPVPGQSARRVQGARAGALRRYRGIAAEATATTTYTRLANRQYGVEIEVKGLNSNDATRVLVGIGLNVVDPGYDHVVRTGQWKVVYDGSLTGTSCEVVSPPLSGDEGMTQIKQVVDALREAGARIDRECGLHVHHEVVDLTGDEVATLIEMYAGNYATMDALVAPSRRRGGASYCRRFSGEELERFAAAFRTGISRPADARRFGIGDRPESRYRVLNVHSYANYGTIEFRQHQGTLSGAKIAAWVALGQAMIEAARARTAIRQDALLASLLDAGHLDQQQHDFLSRRQAALAS